MGGRAEHRHRCWLPFSEYGGTWASLGFNQERVGVRFVLGSPPGRGGSWSEAVHKEGSPEAGASRKGHGTELSWALRSCDHGVEHRTSLPLCLEPAAPLPTPRSSTGSPRTEMKGTCPTKQNTHGPRHQEPCLFPPPQLQSFLDGGCAMC